MTIIGCVIMASGLSRRFGSNKLLEPYNGKPMIENVFQAIPSGIFTKKIVVTPYPAIAELAQKYQINRIDNAYQEYGQSQSIILGVQQMIDMDAIAFIVGDQPNLTQESIIKLTNTYNENIGKIVALASNGKRGNPVIFPSTLYSELLTLSGDVGGSAVIRHHENLLITVEASEIELRDYDTRKEIESTMLTHYNQ